MKVSGDRLLKQVIKDAKTIVGFDGKLGSNVTTALDKDCTVKSKLYGYNSSKKGVIIEVSINNVLIERISMTRKSPEDEFVPRYQYDFNKLYQIRSKTPVQPPVDEPFE